ncbi:MAG: BrnA antitoxin family protein [Pyrinomonadaceae bacterium]|nr:BrnA antitoxin family protein [Pyrinomonadaceae bacterium]
MKNPETDSTSETFEAEYTEADIQEMRDQGVSEEDLPSVGKHTFRRSRFIVPRKEQKLKVTIMLDADVLDFYKEQAAKAGNLPYQTQINRQLRKAMEKAKDPKSQVVTLEMLENPAFLSKLADKLKKVA